MQKQLQDIMQKEMSRKEFLVTAGLGVASVLGFSTFIKMVSGRSFGTQTPQSLGYGASAYGGNKKA